MIDYFSVTFNECHGVGHLQMSDSDDMKRSYMNHMIQKTIIIKDYLSGWVLEMGIC